MLRRLANTTCVGTPARRQTVASREWLRRPRVWAPDSAAPNTRQAADVSRSPHAQRSCQAARGKPSSRTWLTRPQVLPERSMLGARPKRFGGPGRTFRSACDPNSARASASRAGHVIQAMWVTRPPWSYQVQGCARAAIRASRADRSVAKDGSVGCTHSGACGRYSSEPCGLNLS